MDRINGAGHLGHMFVSEDVQQGRAPTEVTPEWLNGVQEELVNLILAKPGAVLSTLDNTQLLGAVQYFIGQCQPSSAKLSALAALIVAADKLIYATGASTFATTTLTSFARTLLDDTTAAAALATLGAAPLASPLFTGVPAVPTAAVGTNTTQAASTAFVQAAVAALVGASPAALDTLNELAAALGNDANFATTTTNSLAGKAPLDSPVFTGVPVAPNPLTGARTDQVATMRKFSDEFVASLGVNGYQKLPSGLILQWGSTAALPAGSTTAITFPIAFPSACLSVTVNGANSSGSWYAPGFAAKTATGFGLVTPSSGSTNYNWIAVGY